tara:strand:- start:632 stop:2458 length:1827 start_codon:yes stop_codon:yes gene_type:complete
MKHLKKVLLLLVLTLGILECVKASDKKFDKTKEVLTKTSFVNKSQKDSTLYKKYKEVQKLLKDKEYVIALREALKLYDESKNSNDQKIEFLSSFLIGEIHRLNRNYSKSLNYFKLSINVLNSSKSELGELQNFSSEEYARNLLRLGSVFQRLKMNDSAIVHYQNLGRLNSLNDKVLSFQAASYTNLSGIYQKDTILTDSYSKSINYAEKAIKIHKERNNKISQARSVNNLANIYLIKGNYKKSKRIYNEGLRLIEKDSSTRAIRLKANLYYNLAWAMRKLKEYEAYDNLERSYLYQDGLRDVETQEMLERVTGEYNVNNFRREEDLKRQIVINQKQKAQKNTWILGISSFFIILLLVFLLNQYKLRQKNLGLELSKQELMQQQKLEKIKSESQVRILNATLDGKETERKQIAETLHDSVSALLSSANLHLQACKKQFNGSTPVEVDKSQSIINEASQKIRDLSHTLVSSILLKFGLSYAIKDVTEKFSNSQLTIDSETKYIKRYDQGFEIKLYNIIQEFINNILKHSEATYAKITLVEKNKKLLLTIQDNGKGFDKTLIPEKDGLGINQIDARIQMMQGKFHIESGKGKGTVIKIELPVFAKKLAAIS